MRLNPKSAWERVVSEVMHVDNASPVEPDRVFNGSFEQGSGPGPDGWHLAEGALGVSTRWCTDGGVDGGRCLYLTPAGGGASWYSRPIAVTGGAEYLFQCAMKRNGQGHWPHKCAIHGVCIIFADAEGAPVESATDYDASLIGVRARHTDGWVCGWRHLVVPDIASYLILGFRIARGERLATDAHTLEGHWHDDVDSGEWWIDDVRLERMPLDVEALQGTLVVHIPGKGARLRISNTQSATFSPKGAYTFDAHGGCFHALRERVQIGLPPGSYTVEAVRGFQRDPFHKTVEISEGHECHVTAEVPRVADWAAEGWYCGDHHVHLASHGSTRHPMMTYDDVCRIARGEGLDFVVVCGDIRDVKDYVEWREGMRPRESRPDGAVEHEDFLGAISHEIIDDLLGHACLINPPANLPPGDPSRPGPAHADASLSVHRGGRKAALVLAHPFLGLTSQGALTQIADPTATGLYRELPVDTVLGFADTMEVPLSAPDEELDVQFRDYFRLLNLGLRLGVCGGSDAYVDQGVRLPGEVVTLVSADRLSLDAIAAGYEHRRTIVSNGPLLSLKANGQGIGRTVKGPLLEIEARAYSNWGLRKLEVLFNGEVIADGTPDTEGWIRLNAAFGAQQSGWLMARVDGPRMTPLAHEGASCLSVPTTRQRAVTSPLYVEVPGKPLVPRKADALYFIAWIDAAMEAIRGRVSSMATLNPSAGMSCAQDFSGTLDLFRRAREVFADYL